MSLYTLTTTSGPASTLAVASSATTQVSSASSTQVLSQPNAPVLNGLGEIVIRIEDALRSFLPAAVINLITPYFEVSSEEIAALAAWPVRELIPNSILTQFEQDLAACRTTNSNANTYLCFMTSHATFGLIEETRIAQQYGRAMERSAASAPDPSLPVGPPVLSQIRQDGNRLVEEILTIVLNNKRRGATASDIIAQEGAAWCTRVDRWTSKVIEDIRRSPCVSTGNQHGPAVRIAFVAAGLRQTPRQGMPDLYSCQHGCSAQIRVFHSWSTPPAHDATCILTSRMRAMTIGNGNGQTGAGAGAGIG